MRIELGNLSIIDRNQKRALECYIDSRLIEQRKDFDEYTVSVSNYKCKADLSLLDLMLLAELFSVKVGPNEIYIGDL